MTEKAELCKLCEEEPVVSNDLCNGCLTRALEAAKQKPQVTDQEAARVLLAGQMRRVQAAQKEAEAVYAKYRVVLDVYMIVRPNGTIVQAQFVPQEGWAGDPSDV